MKRKRDKFLFGRLQRKREAKKVASQAKTYAFLSEGESQCGKRAIISAEHANGVPPCWNCGLYHEGGA